jgi:hypothetical protein
LNSKIMRGSRENDGFGSEPDKAGLGTASFAALGGAMLLTAFHPHHAIPLCVLLLSLAGLGFLLENGLRGSRATSIFAFRSPSRIELLGSLLVGVILLVTAAGTTGATVGWVALGLWAVLVLGPLAGGRGA